MQEWMSECSVTRSPGLCLRARGHSCCFQYAVLILTRNYCWMTAELIGFFSLQPAALWAVWAWEMKNPERCSVTIMGTDWVLWEEEKQRNILLLFPDSWSPNLAHVPWEHSRGVEWAGQAPPLPSWQPWRRWNHSDFSLYQQSPEQNLRVSRHPLDTGLQMNRNSG